MNEKLIENIFFFSLLAVVSYLGWELLVPFMPALVLASIIATVCYPMHRWIRRKIPLKGNGFPALLTTLLVFILVVGPLGLIGYLVFLEAANFYTAVNAGRAISIAPTLSLAQDVLDRFVPSSGINLAIYAKEGAGWLATSLGTLFTSTASLVFMLFIAFIGLYYLFKDGDQLIETVMHLSPLPDKEDTKILNRLAQSVRSVLLGRLLLGLVQGILTTIGFMIFGVPQAVLWGMVASIAALIPAIGTSLVFIPTVAFLILGESYSAAIGVAVWGLVVVGLIDNLLGPYLMSRGAPMHPFFILISALGGLAVFGPVGFVLGPVIFSFFIALVEIYEDYISKRS